MRPLHRWFTLFAALVAIAVSGGCVAQRLSSRTCAVLLVLDGKQVYPTARQFAAVERKLAPMFRERGFLLMRELEETDFIATVECRVDPADAARTDLIVRDIADNTFRRSVNRVVFPSIQQVEREQAEVMTRP